MKTNKIGMFACGLIVLFTACEKGGVFCYSPKGEQIVEERILENFSKIELGTSADVYVSQGADYEVKVEASENLMEIIETKVSENTLKIDIKKNKCIRGNNSFKVYVQLPTLNALSVSGSGQIFVANLMQTNALNVDISGSGEIIMDSLDAQYITENISGSGYVSLRSVDTVLTQTIDISGSGQVEALGMPSRDTKINVSGSGEGKLHVIDYLDVNISGSGDVIYLGNPLINQNVSGSGKIKHY